MRVTEYQEIHLAIKKEKANLKLHSNKVVALRIILAAYFEEQ